MSPILIQYVGDTKYVWTSARVCATPESAATASATSTGR